MSKSASPKAPTIPQVPADAPDTWHVVLSAPSHLKKHIKHDGNPGLDLSVIAKADAALKNLSLQFDDWMDGEIERLAEASKVLSEQGYTPETLMSLYRVSHDIRGEALTFGFPLSARVADSLCTLIDMAPDKTRIPTIVIDQHIQTIRAIVAERAKGEGSPIARTLAKRLCDVTSEFIRAEMAAAAKA